LDDFALIHSFNAAKDLSKKIEESQGYVDIHCSCFTPSSFRLIIDDLYNLGYIKLKEEYVHQTVGHEFFVTLSFNGSGIKNSRLELLKKIKNELQIKN